MVLQHYTNAHSHLLYQQLKIPSLMSLRYLHVPFVLKLTAD